MTDSQITELNKQGYQVIEGQHEVEKDTAIVNALTDRANMCQELLADVAIQRTQALANKNIIDDIVIRVADLQVSSSSNSIALGEVKEGTDALAGKMKTLVDKLIYSADLINKLGNLITRKKALNPLISDDLVSRINKAGSEANNTVTLTLIALKSAIATQGTNAESQAAAALGSSLALSLYGSLAGSEAIHWDNTLQGLLHRYYSDCTQKYEEASAANAAVIQQLSLAKAKLENAQANVAATQAGLKGRNLS